MGVPNAADYGLQQRASGLDARSATFGVPLPVLAAALILMLVAVGLPFVATPHGIGITADSAEYLSAASSILQGQLLDHRTQATQVATHFPPGFSVALAAVAGFGLSELAAVRVLNAAAMIATGLLTFVLTKRATGGSSTAAIAGMVVVVYARDMQAAHSMVWSEPLFIALTLSVLLATAIAIQENSRRAFVAAILLAGAAGLTRYAAPSVIGTAALAFLLLGHQSRRSRMRRALTFLSASSAPIVLLLAFNTMQAQSATNRELAFHLPALEHVRSAVRTVYYWVLPIHGPLWLEMGLFVAISLAGLFAVAVVLRSWLMKDRRFTRSAVPDRAILGLFLVGFVLFSLTALTFFDAQAVPDARLLLPLVPPLAILVIAAINDALRFPDTRRPAAALASFLLLGLVCSTAIWVESTRRLGLGYNTHAWKRSPLMTVIHDLPPETLVFSNHPVAIFVHGARDARQIPRLASPTSLRRNVDYRRQMGAVCSQASSAPIVYAHFTIEALEWFLPSLSDVRRYWRSTPMAVTSDGVLETIPTGCAVLAAESGR